MWQRIDFNILVSNTDEFLLAATTQNLRRMAKLLSQPPPGNRIGTPADLINKDHHLSRWWHTRKITPCQLAGYSQYRQPCTEFFNRIDHKKTFPEIPRRSRL
jgi:hypothetical protein